MVTSAPNQRVHAGIRTCHSSTSKGLGVWQWEFTASRRQAHPWHYAVGSSTGVLCKMLRTGCRESFAVYVCVGCI